MDIWILVVILLVISIVLFIMSLSMKDNSNFEGKLDEYTEQHSQELYQLKTRIAELESGRRSGNGQSMGSRTTNVALEEVNVVEDMGSISDLTKEEVIRLYSQGYTMAEISHSVSLTPATIQQIVDDYIENR